MGVTGVPTCAVVVSLIAAGKQKPRLFPGEALNLRRESPANIGRGK